MSGDWHPEQYARNAGFVATLGAPLIELLDPRPGERVLDLGCGDGRLTAELAQRGCSVVAVDSSSEQAAAARRRGLDARTLDSQRLRFRQAFDAVFSNAALHWMPDQAAVIAGVARALVPGGRFLAELGADGNVARVRAALHATLAAHGIDPEPLDPWVFPDVPTMQRLLETRGFSVEHLERFERPTALPGSLGDWLETLATPFLAPLKPRTRAAVVDEVSRRTAPALRDADGGWELDYVRLRLRASLTATSHKTRERAVADPR